MRSFGNAFPALRGDVPGPESLRLGARLGQVESRNLLPTTAAPPPFWKEALGVNVLDADGNVLLDLTGAFGVAVAGHRHPRIVEAIRGGTERLIHGMGDVHPSAERLNLLEELSARAPWPSAKGVLSSSGSEAVETALKTALVATGRPGVVAFRGGYHGLTLGSLAVTDREHFRQRFRERLFRGVSFVPFPDTGGEKLEEVLAEVDRVLAEGAPDGSSVGAILVEPIQGRGGVRVPPPGFLKALSERARSAGALLILDEIFTGLGRTGDFFAFHHDDVVPDLLCLGKALGGGLPLSACLGSSEVMDAWPRSGGEAIHTSTFLGHPLACHAALAFLSVLDDEELPRRAERTGGTLASLLREGFADLGGRAEVRGRGLFLGVALSDPDGVRSSSGGGVRVARRLLRRGIVVLPAGAGGEVVELTPPLVLDEELARYAATEVVAAVRSVTEEDWRDKA